MAAKIVRARDSKEITKPFAYAGKNITKITRDSDGKTLTFLLPWRHAVTFSSPVDVRVGGGVHHWNFHKFGYLFNETGNKQFYRQNFDGSPWGFRYKRHWSHAIGYEEAIFPKHFIQDGRKVRMRFVAGSVSAYQGTVSATSSDRGLAEGQIEFWTEGGQTKMKLNYNKPYVAHNGVRQRHYPGALSGDMTVGIPYDLTNSWKRISTFTYNTRGGFWAMIYIRINGANIEIAQKCDWHAARVELGVFAILGYDIQG